MPFGSSVSKPASSGGMVMPFCLWNKREDVSGVDIALWFTKVTKQFSKEISVM